MVDVADVGQGRVCTGLLVGGKRCGGGRDQDRVCGGDGAGANGSMPEDHGKLKATDGGDSSMAPSLGATFGEILEGPN